MRIISKSIGRRVGFCALLVSRSNWFVCVAALNQSVCIGTHGRCSLYALGRFWVNRWTPVSSNAFVTH